MMQTALKIHSEGRKYSYADYLTWDDDKRWEIINGEVYDMSPAPSNEHQTISWELSGQIRDYLKTNNKPCKAFHAPFDVRLPEGIKDHGKVIDVVQPDIVVVCDLSKLDDNGCQGAPDFIIEILSPSTAYKDHNIKRALYELNKVKEYWIVDPMAKIVTVYLLSEDNRYGKSAIYEGKGKLKAVVLKGLEIDLDAVFKIL
jgi:Uma2 family endonuclease